MAWTKTVSIGKYGSKLQTSVTLRSQSKSNNRSYVRVEVKVYNGGISRTYNTGSGITVKLGGSTSKTWSGVTFNIPGRAWHILASGNFTITHRSDGTMPLVIDGVLGSTGTSALGSGATATVKKTLKRLVLAPTKPSWGSTKYVKAGQARIAWTNHATARGPYSGLQVQQYDAASGKWKSRASLSSGSTAYTDSSIPSNTRVKWRVRAKGVGGTSGWVYGGTMGTVPAAPDRVTAVKRGTGIKLSWRDRAGSTGVERIYIIEDSPDGGAWERVDYIGGSATSFTHTNPDPAVTHRYRVQTKITSQISLYSSWSAPTATVQLQAAPKQPTRKLPLDVEPLVHGEPTRLVWVHNPVDTTEQTAAEVQWRIDGGDWVSDTTAGADEYLDIAPVPAAARAQLQWRVRTKGDHPDYSPWSTAKGPVISTTPTVALQTPTYGDTVDTSRLSVVWAYDGGGTASQLDLAEYRVTLLQGGSARETQTGSAGDSVDLDSRLDNTTEYVVRVEVRNGDGLWAEPDEAVILTKFPIPAKVTVYPEWDHDTGAVSLGFGEAETPRAIHAWEGEQGASPSVRTLDGETVRNLTPAPFGPQADAAQLALWRTSTGCTLTLEDVDDRPAALLVNDDGEGSNYVDPLPPNLAPTVGTVLTFSVDVMVTAPTDRMRLRITPYDGAALDGGSTGYLTQDPEDGWVRHTVQAIITAMPTGGTIRTLIWPGGAFPAGEGFYFRDVIVYEGEDEVPFFDGDTVSVSDVDAIDVERRDEDGDWVRIASALDTSTTITDRTPRLGRVQYRAISRTILPTETSGPVAVTDWVHGHDPVYVNGGDGMAVVCLARGAEATDTITIDQEAQRFAGQALPTAFFGPGRTTETTFTGTILAHPMRPVSTRTEWVDLLHRYGVVCFRDCTGRKLYGLLETGFSTSGNVETVNLTVQETQYDEGVARVSDVELEQRITGNDEGDE